MFGKYNGFVSKERVSACMYFLVVRPITRACAITSKTVHHIMEDNFALRYVLKPPGVNSRAELVPSPRAYTRNGASRRWLGDEINNFFIKAKKVNSRKELTKIYIVPN
jgi:hypothetical protein